MRLAVRFDCHPLNVDATLRPVIATTLRGVVNWSTPRSVVATFERNEFRPAERGGNVVGGVCGPSRVGVTEAADN